MTSIFQSSSDTVVAVIGGGVAGATAAVHLAEIGISTTLLEKGPGLVNGPPICHLHAGGNLYREISDEQCFELLRQSIDSVRLFPQTINRRPTVIAVPKRDPYSPDDLLPRLKQVQSRYRELVDSDARNQVLGHPDDYFSVFYREDIERLKVQSQATFPESHAQWLIPFARETNLDELKYPVVVVEEYGWSVFRLAACAELTLEHYSHATIKCNSELVDAEYNRGQWTLTYIDENRLQQTMTCDYLINACGYKTGTLDDMVALPRQRMVEFKAAYVSQWDSDQAYWPEVIFHGQRGTPQGMAQLTPYADGVFQLHGMTNSITLFNDGLAKSDACSAQPRLPSHLDQMLSDGWQSDIVAERTHKAIAYVAQFIPSYQAATSLGTPLFGAQQIPGEDADLRAADVIFADTPYACIEIVKGSSALEAANKIAQHWRLSSSPIDQNKSIETIHPYTTQLSQRAVEDLAIEIAASRGFHQGLAKVVGRDWSSKDRVPGAVNIRDGVV